MTTITKLYDLFLQTGKVSTDSRKIEPGCLFFALKGANFNGNKYAQEALNKGAAYAIIDEPEYYSNERTLLVDNVLKSLQRLANYYRKELGIPVLGITGTNGKTTTKELVAAVLSQKFKIAYTQGNLNNHIGVPLTLLSMPANTQFAVIEMGASHPGDIDELCRIADPDYGIITNIGKAHLQGFGSFEGVIQTKSELYRHLMPKNGTIFYNRNNPILHNLVKDYPECVSYGDTEADFCGDLIDSPPFVHVKAVFPKGVLYLNTQLFGNYNFENVLAAACIGNYFGIDPLLIQSAIKNYRPTNNRSQLITRGELKIIMDAYNANPTSMKAAIENFAQNEGTRKILILGDMLELGKYSQKEHQELLSKIKEFGFEEVFLIGKEFGAANQGFCFKSFEQVDELGEFITKNPIKNGNLLIKGSRGIQLEKILQYL